MAVPGDGRREKTDRDHSGHGRSRDEHAPATELEDLSAQPTPPPVPPRASRPPPTPPPRSEPAPRAAAPTLRAPSPQTTDRSASSATDSPSDAAPPPRAPQPTTGAHRFIVEVAGFLFAYAVMAQVLLVIWLGVSAAVVAGAAGILLTNGSFELEVLRQCTLAALAIDGVLLAWFLYAWAEMSARHPPAHPPFRLRHPAQFGAIGLLTAIGVLTLLSWARDARGMREVTTSVVLAAAYYFAVVVAVWSLRLLVAGWRGLKRWALTSPFRAGAVTALLVVLALAGALLSYLRWYRVPLRWARDELDLSALAEATDALEAEQAVLCVGSQEIVERVDGAAPPGSCTLRAAIGSLGSAAAVAPHIKSQDDCFSALIAELGAVKRSVMRSWRSIPPDEAHDVVMEALIATCTHEPLPTTPAAYFRTVAHHRAKRLGVQNTRFDCDAELPPTADTPASDLEQADRTRWQRALWRAALQHLKEREAQVVVLRLEDDHRYAAIGARLQMSEAQARTMFHNAMKRLRIVLQRADCVLQ